MEMGQGPFLVGSAPPYPCSPPVPNPEVSQPQQPNVNIAVSSQQTNQQPVQQPVQQQVQPAYPYNQQQPQFVQQGGFQPQPQPQPQPATRPNVNISVSSQQTTQQPVQQPVQQPIQQPVYQYSQQQPQMVQPVFQPQPQPQPAAQPNVNITVSSQQTTQQPAYQPQVVQPRNQVVMMQPNLTETSRQIKCPNCQNTVMTQLRYTNGLLTWVICGVLALFLFLPCMCIPFCVDSCKDVEHSCPSCGHIMHVHKRF